MGNLLACEAQAYRNDPSRCPQCASDKLTTGTADVDLLQTVVPVTCERCGASWDDRYEFAGICDDSLEVGSDIITRECRDIPARLDKWLKTKKAGAS